MAGASIEVSGPDAVRVASEIHRQLAAAAQGGDRVSSVEVDRSGAMAVAIVGLVFTGVSTAKAIWDWWQASRSRGVTVRILMDDGTRIDLSGINGQRLEIEFDRRTQSGT